MERKSAIVWLFSSLLCLGLCAIYLLEWRAAREARSRESARFAETVAAIDRRIASERVETRSLLRALGKGVDELARELRELTRRTAMSGALEFLPPEAEIPEAVEEEAEVEVAGAPPEIRPPLPEGVEPLTVIDAIDLTRFYAEPVFNPHAADLPMIDWQRAVHIATQAQAKLMILRSDFQLLAAEEAQRMTAEGRYVDYPKGQKRDVVPEVYTRGELLPGGTMRIFSYYREEHPRLYEMQRQMKEVAADAVGALMALAAGWGEGGDAGEIMKRVRPVSGGVSRRHVGGTDRSRDVQRCGDLTVAAAAMTPENRSNHRDRVLKSRG